MRPDDADGSVETLLAAGRYADAIDVLSTTNRLHPDPEVERRLVSLRHAAFHELSQRTGREVWPPDYPDPFPGEVGVVEVRGGDLDERLIGGAIKHHGCLLVRGLLAQPDVARLVEDVDRALAAHRDWCAQLEGTDSQDEVPTTPWFTPLDTEDDCAVPNLEYSRRVVEDRVAAADSPRTLFDAIDAVNRSGLTAHAERYLGTRPVLPANKVAIQRVRPGTLLGWHQESKVFGEPVRAFNAWVALNACGRDAPGLEFYPHAFRGLIEADELVPGSYALTQESVDRIDSPVDRVIPQFEAGDALLFDEWLLHRTQFAPDATKDRLSLEFWMFASDGISLSRGPLVC